MSKPANVRITGDLRETIISNLLAACLDERIKAQKAKESALALKIRDWFVGEKNSALMKQLPGEYFFLDSDIRIESAAETIRLRTTEGFRVPLTMQYGSVHLPATHGFWKEARAVKAEDKAIDEDRDALRETAAGLLQGVNTVKTLLIAWPEVEPYLPVFEERSSLPAVRGVELNSLIAKLKK